MENSQVLVMLTPLGAMWICATEKGLCNVGFGETLSPLALRWLERHGIDQPQFGPNALLEKAAAQLGAYFGHNLQDFDLPLDRRGTSFQLAVWEEIAHIPYAQSLTYGEIALEVSRPQAYQAVGRAVGANPLMVVVPCHRVLGQGGAVKGYAAGVERKVALLQLEQAGLQLDFTLEG